MWQETIPHSIPACSLILSIAARVTPVAALADAVLRGDLGQRVDDPDPGLVPLVPFHGPPERGVTGRERDVKPLEILDGYPVGLADPGLPQVVVGVIVLHLVIPESDAALGR